MDKHKPSKRLRKALKETEKIEKNPSEYPTYSNVNELMMVLEDDE